MANIKNLAEACKVSVATVSRALRGVGYVKDEKRRYILAKAEELGYIVDNNAKSLKSGKTNTIGIIVSDIGNYFYNLVLENLISEFKINGFNVLLSYSFENSQYERENIKTMISNKVDAIIFTPISNANSDLISVMEQRGIKMLQIFRQAYDHVDAVCVDDQHGAYLATRHLLNKGFRKILLLSVKLEFTPNRGKGYRQAFEERGLPVDDRFISLHLVGNSIVGGLEKLIKKLNPDSIIAGTNNFGMDAIKVLKQLDYSTPIIVFDDLEWFSLLNISTVAQPIDEIFSKTVQNILCQINDAGKKTKGQVEYVEPHLILRGTLK